jgi:hypothetical protein
MHLPNKCRGRPFDESHLSLHVFSNNEISLRTNRTTPKALIMSSHVRVNFSSRSNNKPQISTHFTRSNRQPAISPPWLYVAAPALLQQALTRSHQVAVSKALRPETYIHVHAHQPPLRQCNNEVVFSLLIFLSSYRLISVYILSAMPMLSSFQASRLSTYHLLCSKVLTIYT